MSSRTRVALALLAPLGLYLLVNFFAPLALLLGRAIEEREIPAAWPHTAAALGAWDGNGLPDQRVIAEFARELAVSRQVGTLSAAANRLNYEAAGWRSLLFDSAARLPLAGSVSLGWLTQVDSRWGEHATWLAIKRAAGPFTAFYLLAALDRRLDANGGVTHAPLEQSVFVGVLAHTFAVSATVTVLCVLLGYPVAYVLAGLSQRVANLLMVFVLLPLWTSVLVRTSAWMVLLQDHGIVNDLLLRLGLISHPVRLIYNRTGVLIAMTHVLLPYFVLPLHGVMRRLSAGTLRAAVSLGASPLRAFWRVYFPETLPGLSAGALIVFILALGYYITPALIGGPGDQMISQFIAFYTTQSLNWGMAAALSLVLLAATLVLVTIYARVAGVRRDMTWR